MNVIVYPTEIAGTVSAIPSKSMAHRMLICAALADAPTSISCETTSEDIEATVSCLNALGAEIQRTDEGFLVEPITASVHDKLLDCGESGSTLRFLLPVIPALGSSATIIGHGRLAERPLSPLREELEAHGASVRGEHTVPLEVSGKLNGSIFELPGDVSSQFVSGLLMAGPILPDGIEVTVKEPVESRSYIELTIDALATFGVKVKVTHDAYATTYIIPADAHYVSPGNVEVEGDWSNAAFWLAAGALSDGGITVCGLKQGSHQGDRAILGALALLGARVSRTNQLVAASRYPLSGCTLNVSDCPDLVPPLAVVAAQAQGLTLICGARRLRLKESDRLATVSDCIVTMGGKVEVTGDGLVIHGIEQLKGGTVDAAGDHRIAMMAAIAACHAEEPTTIIGADCVRKSYPSFFTHLQALGARVERC